MNHDDIIRMAREAGLKAAGDYDFRGSYESMPLFEREELDRVLKFANLVAAENDKKWEKIIAKIDEYASVCNEGIKLSGDLSLAAIDTAVAAEREACARVCEAYMAEGIGREMARAIRARGRATLPSRLVDFEYDGSTNFKGD